MLSLLKLYFFSRHFTPCAHFGPSFSCPAFSCQSFNFLSCNFMFCNFMSCKLVRHFHVLHFQSTRKNHVAWGFNPRQIQVPISFQRYYGKRILYFWLTFRCFCCASLLFSFYAFNYFYMYFHNFVRWISCLMLHSIYSKPFRVNLFSSRQ